MFLLAFLFVSSQFAVEKKNLCCENCSEKCFHLFVALVSLSHHAFPCCVILRRRRKIKNSWRILAILYNSAVKAFLCSYDATRFHTLPNWACLEKFPPLAFYDILPDANWIKWFVLSPISASFSIHSFTHAQRKLNQKSVIQLLLCG